jgi:hypothetical protein
MTLPLETWRSIFSAHPFHFWGLASSAVPVTSDCNVVTKEYAWQDAMAAGRSEIRRAIETAETRLREYLGYPVAPTYLSREISWPGGYQPTVQLPDGYVQAIGVESLALIEEVAVTYTDADSDGLLDTFIATVTTTETDPERLVVYFVPADRLEQAAVSERWRVAPVSITINGGTATIKGRRWLLVRPILYEGIRAAALDPQTAGNLATHIAVYSRHTIDPQATLTWEAGPWPWFCSCTTDASGDPAAIATASARVALRDARHGIVAPAEAVYDADSATWHAAYWGTCRAPDHVTINYLAGLPLVAGQMDPAWQLIVARLAAAELGKPIEACKVSNRELHVWQTDLARTGGNNDEQFGAISAADLDNPFGTRRGHVYAWKRVKQLAQLRGFLPG